MSFSPATDYTISSTNGTLLIAAHRKEGIVVGADSGAFASEFGEILTEQKVVQAGRYAAVGFIGTTSLLIIGDTDTQKRVIIYEEKLLTGAKGALRRLSDATPTQAHAKATAEVQGAIQHFFFRGWALRPNTSPSHISGIITVGYENGRAFLLITDFYRPVGEPLAVGRQDAVKQFDSGKFVFIPFALKSTCTELLDGNNPLLDKSRQLRAVRLYRQRKASGMLDSFTLQETTKLVEACLTVTEQHGALIGPEAHQVRPPNNIGTLTPSGGFQWIVPR